jgi:hypothetical protein
MKTMYRVLLAAAAMQFAAAGAALAQNYSGAYVGTYTASAAPGVHQISLGFSQNGQSMSGGYKASTGVAGVCNGWLNGNVAQMSCYNTTPSCPGNYFGPYTFSAGGVTWTYSGLDCRGPEQGAGKAVKISAHKKK